MRAVVLGGGAVLLAAQAGGVRGLQSDIPLFVRSPTVLRGGTFGSWGGSAR